MNGFEPMRRRIIDYTAAGQWSVAYDGPIEGCETEQLKVENHRLRELVRDMLHWMPCKRPCQRCERYRYPEGCEFEIRRRKLGVDA